MQRYNSADDCVAAVNANHTRNWTAISWLQSNGECFARADGVFPGQAQGQAGLGITSFLACGGAASLHPECTKPRPRLPIMRREFEHVSVALDLNTWQGNITWHTSSP